GAVLAPERADRADRCRPLSQAPRAGSGAGGVEFRADAGRRASDSAGDRDADSLRGRCGAEIVPPLLVRGPAVQRVDPASDGAVDFPVLHGGLIEKELNLRCSPQATLTIRIARPPRLSVARPALIVYPSYGGP